MCVLASGSRYSPFFCDGCREIAVGVSLWAGRLIFPLGRHSFMHTWVPDAPDSNLDGEDADEDADVYALVTGVVSVLMSIDSGSEVLALWSRRIVAQRIAEHRLPKDVKLSMFLSAIGPADAMPRWEAFRALCEFAKSPA